MRILNNKEHDGYVPANIGIGGGDDVEIDIDIDTGKIVNWNNTYVENILKMQENVANEPIRKYFL